MKVKYKGSDIDYVSFDVVMTNLDGDCIKMAII